MSRKERREVQVRQAAGVSVGVVAVSRTPRWSVCPCSDEAAVGSALRSSKAGALMVVAVAVAVAEEWVAEEV